MEDDTLARWRRPGSQQIKAPAKTAAGPDDYDAHEATEGKNRSGGWLDIRPLKGPCSMLAYSELLQIDYDWPNLAFIVLIFRHAMVTIRGRNLASLFSGVQHKLTKLIQQYDPVKDGTPAPDVVIVDSIEFNTQRLSDSVMKMRGQ